MFRVSLHVVCASLSPLPPTSTRPGCRMRARLPCCGLPYLAVSITSTHSSSTTHAGGALGHLYVAEVASAAHERSCTRVHTCFYSEKYLAAQMVCFRVSEENDRRCCAVSHSSACRLHTHESWSISAVAMHSHHKPLWSTAYPSPFACAACCLSHTCTRAHRRQQRSKTQLLRTTWRGTTRRSRTSRTGLAPNNTWKGRCYSLTPSAARPRVCRK